MPRLRSPAGRGAGIPQAPAIRVVFGRCPAQAFGSLQDEPCPCPLFPRKE
jgi:hypothetical protein